MTQADKKKLLAAHRKRGKDTREAILDAWQRDNSALQPEAAAPLPAKSAGGKAQKAQEGRCILRHSFFQPKQTCRSVFSVLVLSCLEADGMAHYSVATDT
jgi:hypothetical protein